MNCEVCIAAMQQLVFLLCSCMCRCYVIYVIYYDMSSMAVMVRQVAVLLWSGCTTGSVCSGVLVSCCSAFPRASGGHRGVHMTGPCKAELDTPIVPQQIHPFGVLLSLHCQPTPQHSSRHGDESYVHLPINGVRSLTLRAGNCRAGAHVATRAKWTFLHSFLSKALC